jgi:hypothetical protein
MTGTFMVQYGQLSGISLNIGYKRMSCCMHEVATHPDVRISLSFAFLRRLGQLIGKKAAPKMLQRFQ